MRGVQISRSGSVQYNAEDLDAPAVVCLCYEALCRWHLGGCLLPSEHGWSDLTGECGKVSRGWARSASGDIDQGIASIEDGIRDYRATGSILITPYWLVLKAEALHLANRTPEALAAIAEAEAVAHRTEERECFAELHRLKGVFLTAVGADETQIEASFCAAIRIAREQKSISLAKRAEATYAEYRRQKTSGTGGRGFRLPRC
jgi:hypothetical protein